MFLLADKTLRENEIKIEGLLLVDKVKGAEGKVIKVMKVFRQGAKWRTETFAEESLIAIDS